VYGIHDYGRMLADRPRVDAYRRALAAVVKPGSVVVDLGAGTGFFALEACRLGAEKVIAIETNDAVHLLPSIAKRNGLANRIEIIARSSTEVLLDRKADVIVADLRGVVPFYLANLSVMADARERLLAPGGVMIPARDVVSAAVVHAPSLYESVVGGWEGHAIDLDPARAASVSTFYNDRLHPISAPDVLTDAAEVTTVVYGVTSELVERTVHLTVHTAGRAHGLALWFDAELHGDIGFTTAPGNDRVYGRGFLPWERPLEVEVGDRLTLDLGVRRGLGDHVWAWTSTLTRGGETVASFRQSTFFGVPAPASSFARESLSYRPRLDVRGRAVAEALSAMDGSRTVAEVAGRIHAAHPGAFASEAEAIEEIRRLARSFG